jgi:hypothetical protein
MKNSFKILKKFALCKYKAAVPLFKKFRKKTRAIEPFIIILIGLVVMIICSGAIVYVTCEIDWVNMPVIKSFIDNNPMLCCIIKLIIGLPSRTWCIIIFIILLLIILYCHIADWDSDSFWRDVDEFLYKRDSYGLDAIDWLGRILVVLFALFWLYGFFK